MLREEERPWVLYTFMVASDASSETAATTTETRGEFILSEQPTIGSNMSAAVVLSCLGGKTGFKFEPMLSRRRVTPLKSSIGRRQ